MQSRAASDPVANVGGKSVSLVVIALRGKKIRKSP